MTKSSTLLNSILEDGLEGLAAITTRVHRENNDFLKCLRTLREAWPEKPDEAKETSVKRKFNFM